MEKTFKTHLAGVVRNPAIFHGEESTATVQSLNLEHYEVSPIEPLHDIKGHIKNVYDLIPYHLEGKAAELFKTEMKIALGKNIYMFYFFNFIKFFVEL